LRQSRAHARLVVGIAIGVLLAATVLAAIPLYLRAISDLGLAYAIDERGATFLDFEAVSYSRPIARRDYEQAWTQAREAIRARIGAFLREERRAAYTPNFVMGQRDPQGRETGPGERSPHAFFFFLTDMQRHILLLEGRPPANPPAPGADMEALLGVWAAGDMRLRAGDVVTFPPFVTDPLPSVRVRIAGIIQPRDMKEDFWLGHQEYFVATRDSGGQSRTFALYVPEDQFFSVLSDRFPVLLVNYWWIATVEPSRIKASDASRIRQSITDLEGDLNRALPRTLVFTGLNRLLDDYERKLVFARVPLVIFALLMLGAVVYYLTMTASFLLQRQAPDQAVLRARGASTGQLVGIFALQGAFVAIPSALLGPAYAYLLVAPLGRFSPLAARTDGRWLSLPFAPEMYLWAAAGAAIAWAALLAPAVIAARRTVVDQRQAAARPETRSPVHRAYIDLLLAAVALVLWLDLSQRGSFLAQRLFGQGPLADGVLLLTPVIALAAGLLLALRLLPLLLGVMASLAQRLPSPALLLALRHMAREPLLSAGPLALLALVTALAVFAASFGATLERSYKERAAYAAGADLRVTASAGQADALAQALPQMPSVQASSLVLRETGRVGPGLSAPDYTLLAVEPDKIQQVAWTRPDFSASPLSDQMWLIR
ncbi:MAG: FtsX-like permease family protein, partial [Chloroflexota bacterium]